MTSPKSFAAPTRRRVRRTNHDVLAEMVKKHHLRARDVAELTRASHHSAVSWTKRGKSARPISDCFLELLCLKLGEPSPFRDHLGVLGGGS